MTEREEDMAQFARAWRNANDAEMARICAVEPIRGPSENAATLLYELLEKAKNGEILSLAIAWEESECTEARACREPGGSYMLLLAKTYRLLGVINDGIESEEG